MKSLRRILPLLLVGAALGAVCFQAPAKKSVTARNLTVFNQLVKELETFYVDSIDSKKSIETAIAAMLDDVDPYTEFINEENRENFSRQTTGEYGGIGSYIQERNGAVYISGPQVGSPALEAGLRPGDKLVIIDGDSVIGIPSGEVSKKLRGTPGSTVNVTVHRPWVGADSVLTFAIPRRKIQERSVDYSGVIGDSIGYIMLSSFIDKTPDEFKEALEGIMAYPGVRGLVLDMRGNGGGLVESAIKVLGYFLPKNTEVLRTRGKEKLNEKIYRTSGKPLAPELPMVVITDPGTASAAEIVSGALQDLDRAVVIGERSFGKGLVQTTRNLPYDNLLKVTVAKYYIPSGRLIQAIDYSRRNPDGSVARIPDSLTNVFHTVAGREVRDGGGITPDVKVEHPDISRITYNLVRDQWIFDFANRYRNTHPEKPAAEPGDFAVSDTLYAEFKEFIDPARFAYDKPCELMIESIRKVTAQEGYDSDSVTAVIDQLATLLHHDLRHDLEKQRKQIEPYLSGEIVERYWQQPGRTRNVLKYDEDIAAAREILLDPTRYKSLLSKPTAKK